MQALAATHGTSGRGLRAYIVGRNASAAEKIIADCLRVCPSGEFKFVKARDLSLMEDVDRVCQEIQRAEEEEVGKGRGGVAKVDLLVETQGYLSFEGRLGILLCSNSHRSLSFRFRKQSLAVIH